MGLSRSQVLRWALVVSMGHALVMKPKFGSGLHEDPDEIFRGALLFGRSHVVPERGTTHYPADAPRDTTGRMRALFTTLQLSDGTKFPICGVIRFFWP